MNNYNFEISEVNNDSWIFNYNKDLKIDRTNKTVENLLEDLGIKWSVNNYKADVLLFKEYVHTVNPKSLLKRTFEILRKLYKNYINIIGEPVEYTPLAWTFDNPQNTLSIAPDNRFTRFFFPSEWMDPELENWNQRIDKFIYIGVPSEERIKQVMHLKNIGIEIDVYGRRPWPIAGFKGKFDGYLNDAFKLYKKYKYRLVIENVYTHLYHSEKLFNTARAGTIPFYLCDPKLDLPHIKDISIMPTEENLLNRKELAPRILENIHDFMFSSKWEIYSIKNQYLQIIEFAKKQLRK